MRERHKNRRYATPKKSEVLEKTPVGGVVTLDRDYEVVRWLRDPIAAAEITRGYPGRIMRPMGKGWAVLRPLPLPVPD